MSNELLIEHNAHMLQEAFRLTQKCGDFEWSMEGCDNKWESASVCPPLWTSIATAKYYVRRVFPVTVVTEDEKRAKHNLEMQAKAAELLKTDGDYLWNYNAGSYFLCSRTSPTWGAQRIYKYDVRPVLKPEYKEYTDIDQVQLGRYAQWTHKGRVYQGPVSACMVNDELCVGIGPWVLCLADALEEAVYLDENFKPTNEPLGQLKKASS